MSKHMLDVVTNLIKTRDALAKVTDEVNHFRQRVDGSVNDIVDWLKNQNIITVKDDDASKFGREELEQSVVDRSQKERTGADGLNKSRDAL